MPEKLAEELFEVGQTKIGLPTKKFTFYWDSIRLDEIGFSKFPDGKYEIHLNEIMFFTYHEDYVESVIPHEVAHLLHFEKWGIGNRLHDESFAWIVREIAPDYTFRNLDKMPACRFLRRLARANGYRGNVQVCG